MSSENIRIKNLGNRFLKKKILGNWNRSAGVGGKSYTYTKS